MSDEERYQAYAAKVKLADDVKKFLESDAGKYIISFLNAEYTTAQNTIIQPKCEHVDIIRGEMLLISKFYNKLNAVLQTGEKAATTLASWRET